MARIEGVKANKEIITQSRKDINHQLCNVHNTELLRYKKLERYKKF